MEQHKGSGHSFKLMVGTYFLAWGFAGLDRLLIAMLFPLVLPEFGLGFAEGGLLMAAMALSYLVFAFVGGVLSDKFGRKKVILPSVFLFSIGSAITGAVGSFAQLIGIRSIIGAAEGAFNMSATAQIAEESPPEKRGLYVGLYTSAFPLFASLVAPLYATQAAAAWGWRMACYLTIIPGIILAAIIWFGIKESKRFETSAAPECKETSSWKEIITQKNILVGSLIAIFWMIWLWSWLSFGMSFLVSVKGFDSATAGMLMAALGLGGFLGCFLLPALSDKVGRKLPIIVGPIIGFLGTLAILNIPASSFGLLAGTMFITAFSTWGLAPIFLSVIPSEAVPAKLCGTGIGVVTCIGELAGIVIAPPLLGMIADKSGLGTAMLCSAVPLIAVIIFSFFLQETAPRLVNVSKESTN